MHPLYLSTPEQHDFRDPTVERNAGRLRAWLTDLPLMDVVETLRLVVNALDSCNEQRLKPGDRFRLLEVFRDTAQRLFVTVDPLHIRQLALSKSQREQATQGVEKLLLAMAGGYKIIVNALYEQTAAGDSNGLFASAVNRAMEHLGYVLLDSYRFYRSSEDFIFSELHQLYRIARHYGLLEVTVTDKDEAEAPPGIAAGYHGTLLLSLTDPFRLAEGEVGLLHGVLKQYAAMCRIIPGNQWTGSPEGLFLIDLAGEGPPVSCLRLESPAKAAEPYLLDAREALRAIHARLAQTPKKVRAQSPEATVLRRLLPEDVDPVKNREARHPDSRWVNLLLGLEGIHEFLLHTGRTGGQTAALAGNSNAHEPYTCRVVDTSEHGMRLAWDDGGAGDARVGELLGVFGEAERLQLAMIRSIRVYREGGMEIGVQIIDGSSAAVFCRPHEDADDRTVRALFMPASEEQEMPATLIATKGFFEQGRRLVVDVSGKEVPVRAGRSILDSPVFDRVEFTADSG